MRIGISAFAGDGGRSGISQYMAQIVSRLAAKAPQHRFIAFVGAEDADWVRGWDPRIEVVPFSGAVSRPLGSIAWHLLRFRPALRRHRCDLAFMPAANRRLAWSYGVPSLGTVHDFSQLHVPQKYDRLRTFYSLRVLPAMMRRLDRIVAVSDATRRDLEGFARVPAARIHVIHNGADLQRYTPHGRAAARAEVQRWLGDRLPADAPYLLYTARLEHPGKNHVRLLEAFAQLRRERGLPHRLVLAGGRWSGADAIDAKAAALGLGGAVVFPGFVPDALLPALYRAADLFVFPSLFEGFGIPLLEAMASGTPVCAAERASIPEVLGDAGVLFDPEEPRAIAAALARLLDDTAVRERCVARGLARCQQFTWDRAAEATLAALEGTASARNRA